MPCTSLCNTPILPVRKPNGKGWRFVQDLTSINAIVIPRHSVVPDPHTLVSWIPKDRNVFSVTDLCSAAFSVLSTLVISIFLPLLGMDGNIRGLSCHKAILKAPLLPGIES